jgi:hypothetical protein
MSAAAAAAAAAGPAKMIPLEEIFPNFQHCKT